LLTQARTVIETKGIPPKKASPTVLDAIYQSELLSPEEKTLPRMMAETQALLGAGTETTGNTLSTLTFHLLSNPAILQKLKAELNTAAAALGRESSGLLEFKVLDKLSYLQSCIKEALRLAIGVVGRLPRVNPVAPMSYTTPSGKTYILPPNTAVSMSIRDMHMDNTIFPNPHSFIPERWIESSPDHLRQMEKAYAPFGRGARACLGVELAKEELTLMAGNLFLRFDFDLFETTARDVSILHDYFAPFGPKDSQGVRVTVR
jgi:cytochrome P450